MPFTDLLFPWQNAWLLLLLVVWAALLFGGFLFGHPTREASRPGGAAAARRMPRWTRMTSSLALVAAAWSWFGFSGDQAGPYPLLIAIGMTLGCLGDFFLARLLPVAQPVLAGMASFGLGHVAYISAILFYLDDRRAAAAYMGQPSPLAPWLAWLVVGALGWYVVVWRGQRHTLLHRVALPYALLLASTAGFATGLALLSLSFVPLALGATLFLISDLILAARLFNNASFPLIDDVVWLTYGPGQALIVFSVAAALAYLRPLLGF